MRMILRAYPNELCVCQCTLYRDFKYSVVTFQHDLGLSTHHAISINYDALVNNTNRWLVRQL